jgi:hypothetical protein
MRVIFRGTKSRFTQTFFDGATPLVPLNANYPKYAIYDINNANVQNGVGILQSAGNYYADWTSLLTAQLSNEIGNWRIEWIFKDDNSREYTFTENFELKDDVSVQEAGREVKFIALAGQPYLATLVVPNPLFDVSAKVYNKNTEQVLMGATLAGMTKRSGDNLHSYEFTVGALNNPAGLEICAGTEYMIVWTIKDAATSVPRFQFQIVSGLGIKKIALIPEVRMLIDKFQKIAGTHQGYEDSDINEYLDRGLEMVNSIYPATPTWGAIGNSAAANSSSSNLWYSNGMHYFWIMGAAWWGLSAQHLLETDMAFSYTGLTTTLEVNRAAEIENALTKFREHIKETLPPMKMTMLRKLNGMGSVGTRIFGRRATFENFSYKIGEGKGNTVLNYLDGLGIFYP